jgi:uncharacterized protein (TIGR03118 family)
MFFPSRTPVARRCAAAATIAAGLSLAGMAAAQPYVNQVLTDNICCEESHFDRRLAKAWGVAFDPTGFAWVAANFAGRAELFDGEGNPQSLSVRIEVPPLFNGGFVTGLAFNAGDAFPIPNSFAAATPARFLFVTLEGTILGWTPGSSPSPQNTLAPIIINNFVRGDVYTGVAVAQTAVGDRLYIADFFHARIKGLDGSFAPVESAFVDPNLPAGYSPFNIRVLGRHIFVSYGVRNNFGDDAVTGSGNGLVNVFSLDGRFESRLASHGVLNAPWGMAMAPANFGEFSNALLVGNVGDGRINAFNPTTGALLGTLKDSAGAPIAVDGLHGIDFGNGLPGQANNTLYYGAAPTFGVVGVFGRIDPGCRGDFTRDGQITVQDLFDFLPAYFAQSPQADINGVGGVTVQDIFDLLASYFSGCP